VKVRLNANTWPQFNDKVKKNKADIFDYSWNADYPDPENFFQLFYSKNVSPGPNAASFKNKQFDLLYEKSLQLPAGPERTALYIQMEELIMEECPWIFNVHRLRPVLKHAWLRNYKHEVMIADTMKYYSIDSELRAKIKKEGL
jgi:ABC-type oligopeptide transport system substrate-binding subunit